MPFHLRQNLSISIPVDGDDDKRNCNQFSNYDFAILGILFNKFRLTHTLELRTCLRKKVLQGSHAMAP